MGERVTQRQEAKLRILKITHPWTAFEMAKKSSIAATAWHEAAAGLDLLCCNMPISKGNFRRMYFPIRWLPEKCYEYLDLRAKDGQSRAVVVALNSKRLYRRGEIYAIEEFAKKFATADLHV